MHQLRYTTVCGHSLQVHRLENLAESCFPVSFHRLRTAETGSYNYTVLELSIVLICARHNCRLHSEREFLDPQKKRIKKLRFSRILPHITNAKGLGTLNNISKA